MLSVLPSKVISQIADHCDDVTVLHFATTTTKLSRVLRLNLRKREVRVSTYLQLLLIPRSILSTNWLKTLIDFGLVSSSFCDLMTSKDDLSRQLHWLPLDITYEIWRNMMLTPMCKQSIDEKSADEKQSAPCLSGGIGVAMKLFGWYSRWQKESENTKVFEQRRRHRRLHLEQITEFVLLNLRSQLVIDEKFIGKCVQNDMVNTLSFISDTVEFHMIRLRDKEMGKDLRVAFIDAVIYSSIDNNNLSTFVSFMNHVCAKHVLYMLKYAELDFLRTVVDNHSHKPRFHKTFDAVCKRLNPTTFIQVEFLQWYNTRQSSG